MTKIVGVLALLGVTALAVAGAWLAVVSGGAGNKEMANVPLATLWYSWFGYDFDTGEQKRGLKSTHWNLDAGRYGSEVGVTDEPEYGYYASDDPDVIAQQLRDMKKAGINTIFLSWFGWGDDELDGSISSQEGAAMNRAVQVLLEYVKNHEPSFKVAIAVEPFGKFGRSDYVSAPDHIDEQKVVDRLRDTVYDVYPELMFQWDGKPLIIHFHPLDLRVTGDSGFTFKQWGSWPDVNWRDNSDLDWFGHTQVPFDRQISDDGVFIVVPRFDEYWAQVMGAQFDRGIQRSDPYLKDGLYELAWQTAIDHQPAINLIIIYSWNEHGDHSAIEPTKTETPIAAGRTLLEKTEVYFQNFLRGEQIRAEVRTWRQPEEFRRYIGSVQYNELGFPNELEMNRFLGSILGQSQDLIEHYIGLTYSPGEEPAGLHNALFRLSSNMYNYVLQNKRSPLTQAGDYNFALNDDSVFTDSLKADLNLYRKKSGLKVLEF